MVKDEETRRTKKEKRRNWPRRRIGGKGRGEKMKTENKERGWRRKKKIEGIRIKEGRGGERKG